MKRLFSMLTPTRSAPRPSPAIGRGRRRHVQPVYSLLEHRGFPVVITGGWAVEGVAVRVMRVRGDLDLLVARPTGPYGGTPAGTSSQAASCGRRVPRSWTVIPATGRPQARS